MGLVFLFVGLVGFFLLVILEFSLFDRCESKICNAFIEEDTYYCNNY